ncbi:hypothetical protein [Kamptonema formosum]|uniref:hypothetical protein n=1 Tax=Kamptonema formosum TaxID=331992 RepID=UPI00034ACC63|nr:hypothetical protein [Oscillatoria sp. PCC 10802]
MCRRLISGIHPAQMAQLEVRHPEQAEETRLSAVAHRRSGGLRSEQQTCCSQAALLP